MAGDLVYVVHPESSVAAKLRDGLQAADYHVVAMSSVDDAESITRNSQFTIPDAILTPLGGGGAGDSILVTLFESNPMMEQIPLVVVANEEKKNDLLIYLGKGMREASVEFFPPGEKQKAQDWLRQ